MMAGTVLLVQAVAEIKAVVQATGGRPSRSGWEAMKKKKRKKAAMKTGKEMVGK